MKNDAIHSWADTQPLRSPFVLPRGRLGWVAGLVMRWTNDPKAVFDLLDVRLGHEVLEVGYGPGRMIRTLADRSRAAAIVGVDPSPRMQSDASRHNRAAVRAGRVQLLLGTAAATGLDAQRFDRVVSVHNVALWPDLEAGLDELARVLRPEGSLVLAWHGGLARSWVARRLQLPAEKIVRIAAALRARFDAVEQIDQERDVVFRARGRHLSQGER